MLALFVLDTNAVRCILQTCLALRHNDMNGACLVSFVIIFSLGYLCGGMAALLLFGLTLAAHRAALARLMPNLQHLHNDSRGLIQGIVTLNDRERLALMHWAQQRAPGYDRQSSAFRSARATRRRQLSESAKYPPNPVKGQRSEPWRF